HLSLFLRLPGRRPTGSTLFPYTTLFRSSRGTALMGADRRQRKQVKAHCWVYPFSGPVEENYEEDFPNVADDRFSGMCLFRSYSRSEEHTSELQSRENLVCRLLLEKKKKE